MFNPCILIFKNVKKMCPKNSKQSIAEAIKFTPPKLTRGKYAWYVYFYAFHPTECKLKRKRIKINFRKSSVREKLRLANSLISRLTEKLIEGWNPWIEAENSNSYILFDDVIDRFTKRLEKLTSDGMLEKISLESKISHLNVIKTYNKSLNHPIVYIYQFDKKFISNFLDYVYEVRKVTPRTRDNHLSFIRTFCSFLVEKSYLNSRPDESFKVFGSKKFKKKRTSLSDSDLKRLVDWCKENDRHFLLAIYLLFYCCIRPKEMVMLKIGDINIKEQTLIISEEIAKNDKTACVTLPVVVIELMLELNIFSYGNENFIFSKKWKPGLKMYRPDKFRDYWTKVIRPTLKFPASYQFYSLKDTGITHMLKNNVDIISVRDQARHSSIAMTNKYAQTCQLKVIENLKSYKDNVIE